MPTICFTASEQHKRLLERWAKEQDRSVSSVLRQLIEREQERQSTPFNLDVAPEDMAVLIQIAKDGGMATVGDALHYVLMDWIRQQTPIPYSTPEGATQGGN